MCFRLRPCRRNVLVREAEVRKVESSRVLVELESPKEVVPKQWPMAAEAAAAARIAARPRPRAPISILFRGTLRITRVDCRC